KPPGQETNVQSRDTQEMRESRLREALPYLRIERVPARDHQRIHQRCPAPEEHTHEHRERVAQSATPPRPRVEHPRVPDPPHAPLRLPLTEPPTRDQPRRPARRDAICRPPQRDLTFAIRVERVGADHLTPR